MAQASPRAEVPWALSDLRTEFVATVLGAGLIFAAWCGASGTGHQGRQISWIVVGIVGIVVIGTGNFLWLLSGRRAVVARRSELVDGIEKWVTAAEGVGQPASSSTTVLVTIERSARYHVPTCLLVRGKRTEPALLDAAEGDERRPCEMCLP